MIKKVIAGTFVLLIIGSSSGVAYANPTIIRLTPPAQGTVQEVINEEQEAFKLVTPSNNMVSFDTNIVTVFTAPEGTMVTVNVYYNASVDTKKQNYVEAYEPIEVEVGALQRRAVEVELKKGLNKIDFTAVYKDGIKDIISRVIEVKDIVEVDQQVKKDIANTSSTETLKKIVNPESK